ncbi:MAG TPA: hypothetical protein VMR19_02405 [Candidatus Saccharimonadales bacterium]|jgi:hypothetical protein|nr:hypothetical protein [Candidatus Saccharimonadales bacterium]
MSAIDVLVSLCGIAALAFVTVIVIKFLEDTKLLAINKYLAMIASCIFLWFCGAFAGTFVLMQWLEAGVTKTSLNYWSFAAMTLTYCLVFYLTITGIKKIKPKTKKSK